MTTIKEFKKFINRFDDDVEIKVIRSELSLYDVEYVPLNLSEDSDTYTYDEYVQRGQKRKILLFGND